MRSEEQPQSGSLGGGVDRQAILINQVCLNNVLSEPRPACYPDVPPGVPLELVYQFQRIM